MKFSILNTSNAIIQDYFKKPITSSNCEKQNFMIIWGDKNAKLKDNQTVKQQILQKYSFLKNRILQCETSKNFREKAKQYCENNVIFLISGSFAKEVFDGKQNLDWINQQINDLALHSKAIIIFTSDNTIKFNNWSIESLQEKYNYVTQLTVDYDPLYESIDNMIYNRIHRTIEQTKNLDFYFGSKTKEMLTNFQNSEDLNLEDLKPSVIQLKHKLFNICYYIKSAKVKTAVVDYISEKQLQNFYEKIEKCFNVSYKNSENTELTRQDIVENILNLYTEESVIYKILNLFLNTMNPFIYQYMTSINKLFSQCLYEFQDDQEESKIQVYRGGAIQKYQYENLYKGFTQNKKKKLKTYIVFPQFLSSSLKQQIAEAISESRSNEVFEITKARTNQKYSFSKHSIIEDSFIENSSIENSIIENSILKSSPIKNSNKENSSIENSQKVNSSENSSIENSIIEKSILKSSPIKNSKIENSSIENSQKENCSNENCSKENSSKQNSSKQNPSKDNSSKQNSSKINSSKENELYLQSDKFKDHFKIIFNINVKMDLKNQHRPKNIQKISQYEGEKEYLFQPYQQFEVISMDGSDNETKQMSLCYKI